MIKLADLLKEGFEPIDITSEEWVRRVPFLKTFNNFSDLRKIHFQKVTSNSDVDMMYGDDIITFNQINTSIDFTYYVNKINDNYFHNFNLKFKIYLMPPENFPALDKRVLIAAQNITDEKFSYDKEIMSKREHLSKEELNEVINKLNEHFFKFEEFIEGSKAFNIHNPLAEKFS